MKLLNNSLVKISLPPIVLLVIHLIVTETGLYETFWWFDTPMHLLGGILVSLSIISFLNVFIEEKKLLINSNTLKLLIILSITTLFAFSWEVMEYLIDFYYSAGMQISLSDTMKDLCMGFIGGVITSILYIIKKHTK